MKKIVVKAISDLAHDWVSVSRSAYFFKRAFSIFSEFKILENPKHYDYNDILFSFTGWEGWKAIYSKSRLRIICVHGGAIIDRKKLKLRISELTGNFILIVTCKSDYLILMKLGVQKSSIKILPLPVDCSIFKPITNAKKNLGIPSDVFCIAIVSRILPQKNIHTSLKAIKKLREIFPKKKIFLVIVGQVWEEYNILNLRVKNYFDTLATIIDSSFSENEVLFIPKTSTDLNLAMIYNAADVVLHPTLSLDENFGYVPVEASACGTPVIATNYGGLKDTSYNLNLNFAETWLTSGGVREDRSFLLSSLVSITKNSSYYAYNAKKKRK